MLAAVIGLTLMASNEEEAVRDGPADATCRRARASTARSAEETRGQRRGADSEAVNFEFDWHGPPKRRPKPCKHQTRRTDWERVIRGDGRASFVYLLCNEAGVVYTGSSFDPRARLKSHNGGGTRSTRSRGPWRLAATIGPFASTAAARRFESLVKRGGGGLPAKLGAAQRALRKSPLGTTVSIDLSPTSSSTASSSPRHSHVL